MLLDVSIVTDVTVEPVTLAQVKDFCRIDADYTGEDEMLTLLQKSARELLEGFLNLSLAPKVIKVSFVGCTELPYGPHTAVTEVTDNDGNVIDPDNYTVSGLDFKTINAGGANFNYFYPMGVVDYAIIEPVGPLSGTGNVATVSVGYESSKLQSGLKLILLRLVDYMYQNRGSRISDLPTDFRQDAKRYSRNSVL